MLTSMKGEINNNTIIVGDFNTPLTPMDRSTKEKINKETQTLNDTMDQLDLIDIYRTFHPKTMNFTFFSSTFVKKKKINSILVHKVSFNLFQRQYGYPPHPSISTQPCLHPPSSHHLDECREPARDIPLVTKVMRKEARHTQRRDRASGVPLDILEHLPPKKPDSAYFIALCSHL